MYRSDIYEIGYEIQYGDWYNKWYNSYFIEPVGLSWWFIIFTLVNEGSEWIDSCTWYKYIC